MRIETAREAVQARKSTPSKTLREATPAGKFAPTEKSEESKKIRMEIARRQQQKG